MLHMGNAYPKSCCLVRPASIYGALMADKTAEIRTALEQLLYEKVLALYAGLFKQNPLFRWSIQHANYACGMSDVYEYLQKAKAFTIEPVADQITQDVLLISAREDLLVDFELYKKRLTLAHWSSQYPARPSTAKLTATRKISSISRI